MGSREETRREEGRRPFSRVRVYFARIAKIREYSQSTLMLIIERLSLKINNKCTKIVQNSSHVYG